ncbi:hypothetical protein H0O00_05295 [Candidatus Micrarchaeota archaeon]|nr:hypothetical protein [Candidatus Micrarchaeota archaeon]
MDNRLKGSGSRRYVEIERSRFEKQRPLLENLGRSNQERQAMYDINEMMVWARQNKVRLLLMGGYAARAYSGPTRYTHDIDMVVHSEDARKIGLMLKNLGYKRKKLRLSNENVIILGRKANKSKKDCGPATAAHISVSPIYDASSAVAYEPKFSLASNYEKEIFGFYPENGSFSMQARLLRPEELLIVKLMMKKIRSKDLVDSIGIIRYGMCVVPADFSTNEFVGLIKEAGMAEHMRAMIICKIRDGLDNGMLDEAMAAYLDRKLSPGEKDALIEFAGNTIPYLDR